MPAILIVFIAVIAIVVIARVLTKPKVPTSVQWTASSPGPTGSTGPSHSVEDALADIASSARPREIGNLTARIQVRVSDHAPADWYFDLAQGQCAVARGQAESPALSIAANARTWIELAAKRTSFASAYMKGLIQAEGDTAILMRLDDEFSGPVDPSRRAVVNPGTDAPAATVGEHGATASVRAQLSSQALIEALREARENPNLTPEERRAAMADALRQKLGPGADVRVADDGTITANTTSIASTDDKHAQRDEVRAAIKRAMESLPPNATHAQKVEAIRGALRDLPNAGHYAALFGAAGLGKAASEHHEGVGGELAGALLEGVLESLFGGG